MENDQLIREGLLAIGLATLKASNSDYTILMDGISYIIRYNSQEDKVELFNTEKVSE